MMVTNYPTNQDSVIDSRDVIEAIENLEADENDLDDEDADTLRALRALAEEAEQYAEDWQYGEALIRDDYFEDYAKELAADTAPSHEIADLIRNDGQGDCWPLTCCSIDWERAARELQMDYTSVEFDGVTYWTR